MKLLIDSLKLRIGLLVFFCTFFVLSGCGQSRHLTLDESNDGAPLIGTWSGRQFVTVRYTTGFMKFRFVESRDSIPVEIHIDKDAGVSGRIGNAKLSDCRVIKNRGSIGRKLNLATDFAIRGKLEGFIFDGDTIVNKEIAIPFELSTGILSGSVFHKIGIDVFPMAGLNLRKR